MLLNYIDLIEMVALGLSQRNALYLGMTRVSPRARGLAYIALEEAPQPLDQTNRDGRLLLILKGGRGMIREVGPNWPPRWGGRLGGWGARPCHSDRWVPLPSILLPMSSRLFFYIYGPFLST
jgi:hypothetical protein